MSLTRHLSCTSETPVWLAVSSTYVALGDMSITQGPRQLAWEPPAMGQEYLDSLALGGHWQTGRSCFPCCSSEEV